MVDFFLDDFEEPSAAFKATEEQKFAQPSGEMSQHIEKTFAVIQGMLNDELVKSVGGVYHFELHGRPQL